MVLFFKSKVVKVVSPTNSFFPEPFPLHRLANHIGGNQPSTNGMRPSSPASGIKMGAMLPMEVLRVQCESWHPLFTKRVALQATVALFVCSLCFV